MVSAQSDTTAPTVTIVAPGTNKVLTALTGISDTATDSGTGGGNATGLAAVTVGLSRRIGNSFEYWNGTTWVSSFYNMSTTLSGTADTRDWPVSTPLPTGADLVRARYTLNVTARDAANNYRTAVTRNFKLGPDDTTAPVPVITSRANNATVTDVTTISGIVTDPVGSGDVAGSGLGQPVRVH